MWLECILYCQQTGEFSGLYSIPCSALPNSAVILRCFFLHYLLTPEASLAVHERAGATIGHFRSMLLYPLSKHMQYGMFLVSQGVTDGHGTSVSKQTPGSGW